MLLLMTVVLATAMVVGDGILTPSISMLGAVAGLQIATDSFITEGKMPSALAAVNYLSDSACKCTFAL
jgi:K+ transporter